MRLFLIAALIAGIIGCIAYAVPTQIFGVVNAFWLVLGFTFFVFDLLTGGYVVALPARPPA